MNNYNNIILEILEKAYLEKIINDYFEDDIITNKTFKINSSILSGKFDPLFYTGMNVVISVALQNLRQKFSR